MGYGDIVVLLDMIARGAKSVATWRPSCQKLFEESASGRKFLDHSPTLSCDQAVLR